MAGPSSKSQLQVVPQKLIEGPQLATLEDKSIVALIMLRRILVSSNPGSHLSHGLIGG